MTKDGNARQTPPRNFLASISCWCGGLGMMSWVALLILTLAWKNRWSPAHPASGLEFFTLVALGLFGPLLGLVGVVLGLAGIRLAGSSSEGGAGKQAWIGFLLGLCAVPTPLLMFCLVPWRQ